MRDFGELDRERNNVGLADTFERSLSIAVRKHCTLAP